MPTQPNATGKQQFELRDLREPGWFHVDNLDEYAGKLGAYGVAVYAPIDQAREAIARSYEGIPGQKPAPT